MRASRRLLSWPAFAAILAVASVHAAALPQQPRQRTIQVLVLDRNEAPVPDLTERDFTVREDNQAREIVRVSPAAPPPAIVLLIDDSQAAMPVMTDVRSALTAFADTMADQSPAPQIRLSTFGDRPTVVTDFSPSFSAVSRGIERLHGRSSAGATFLDAIVETCRDLRSRKIMDAVIVAFVAEAGPEFSDVRSRMVSDALRGVRASLWTITLQDRNGGNLGDDAARERAAVIGDVTVTSGGRDARVLAQPAIAPAFQKLAGQLLTRYDVTYGRPESLVPPSKLEVTGRDRAWRLQASRWAGE
jgi:hypothetical protein